MIINSNAFIEPIIDIANLRAFVDFVSHLGNTVLSPEDWNLLVAGVNASDIETGDRFEFNLTGDTEDSCSSFASERGHDFHKVHVQIYCSDWMALKINTAAEIMANYKLEPLSD
ncbi:hypothetical protein [Lignipirellula cremea]|uniref:Uncharacterized protein n=1 Tax=Lignipirellula cremea TaxID=2528010 RepID=A0A518DNN4_9BACT|nr:hypothetical protein [Lignipirellula cremea]QDU93442.1 hypothetical protein Pla8534_12220 [Lignipirellula cremea]